MHSPCYVAASKRAPLVLLSVFLLITGCSDSENGDTAVARDSEKTTLDDRIPVEAIRIETGPITSTLALSATVETEETVDVYPLTSGIISELRVEEGDLVHKGDTLITLDAEMEKLAEAKAKVQYERIRNDFARKQSMFAENFISQEEIDNIRYAVEESRLNWETARTNLAYTAIKAPITGTIATRLCKIGDRIQLSSNLFTIVDMREKIIRLNVPQRDVSRLHSRQTVLITSDFIPGRSFRGFIKRMSPVINAASGTMVVTIGLHDDDPALRPGIFVEVNIVLDTHEQATLLPKEAILYENGLPVVFTVVDTVAHKRRLELGFSGATHFEVLAGIQPGDHVITVGQSGLRDRSTVRVVSSGSGFLPVAKEE